MQNKELKLQNVIRKIGELVDNVDNLDYKKKIIWDELTKRECEELSDVSLSLAECHVIDFIARNEMVNTTAIAGRLNITKGGISKITAKLRKKDMVDVKRLPNNQKETYFTLRPLGKKVFQVHEKLHQQAEAEFFALFSRYSEVELGVVSRFLDDLIITFQTETCYQGQISQQLVEATDVSEDR